jgi:hypothetical protein
MQLDISQRTFFKGWGLAVTALLLAGTLQPKASKRRRHCFVLQHSYGFGSYHGMPWDSPGPRAASRSGKGRGR